MKKIIFAILLFAFFTVISVSYYYSYKEDKECTSDLCLASIEALAQLEGPSNFGPVKIVDCAGKTQHKKICMCEPGLSPLCRN